MSRRRTAASRVLLEGPAGSIECLVEEVEQAGNKTVAVVCHPHPLYGGTMDNKVVHTLSRALHEVQVSTVRFNFRGVGKSQGEHDKGEGETGDALHVADWALRHLGGTELWLGGFSFGAWIALRAASRVPCARLITIAPPVRRFAITEETQPGCPWLVVQGADDELVSCNAVIEWLNQLRPGPELVVLPDADHFFHGALTVLRETLVENLGTRDVSTT